MAVTTNLGRVGLLPKGEYDAGTPYVRLDVATYEGNAYVALKDNTGVTPGTDLETWQPLAAQGGIGPTGPEGKVGPQGEPGKDGEKGDKGNGITSVVQNEDSSLTINFDDLEPFQTSPLKGEKGDQGAPNIVKGPAYDSVDALQEAVPSPSEGDQYNVGTEAPYNVYRWTGTEWEDQGKTQGPAGPAGKDGKDGENGKDGAPGEPGEPGEPGAPGKPPRIGEDNTWELWDEESGDWKSTGIKAAMERLSATIPAEGWTGEKEKTITVRVEGVDPHNGHAADIARTEDADADAAARAGWAHMTHIDATAGQITLYADKEPEAEMPIELFVWGGDPTKDVAKSSVFIMRRGTATGGSGTSIEGAEVELDETSWTYDGGEHAPKVTSVKLAGNPLVEWQDYVYVATPATNAGSYNVLVMGVMNYGGACSVLWSIERAVGTVSVGEGNSMTVTGVMGTVGTETITHNGDGEITAESQAQETATAEVAGDTLRVKSVKAGSTTVTVRVAESQNYTAASCDVSVQINKATGSISVEPQSIQITGAAGTEGEVALNVTGDGDVSASESSYVTARREGNKLKLVSVAPGSDTLTITLAETENYTGASCTLQVEVITKTTHIWGVTWDGTGSKWQRTDDAVDFPDPVPYHAGMNGSPSSPFDDIDPWKTLKDTTTDPDCGSVQPCQKFWYELKALPGGGLSLRVADGEVEGFVVDPAHMRLSDSEPEVDTVLIGTYHCADGTNKSETGKDAACNGTRSAAREKVRALGDHVEQHNFITRFSLWLLYLVEMGDWNGERIGRGCSDVSGTKKPNGQCDSIPYHTGTTASSPDEYGFVKWRNFSGLWDTVYDWLDGCYYDANGLNIILDPAKYSDTENGVLVGKPTSGYPSKFTVSDAAGFPMFYPTESSGSASTGSCDDWGVGSGSNPCLCAGGNSSQGQSRGPFYVSYYGVTSADGYIGWRLQKRVPSGGV